MKASCTQVSNIQLNQAKPVVKQGRKATDLAVFGKLMLFVPVMMRLFHEPG
jgi:hypothetical protein